MDYNKLKTFVLVAETGSITETGLILGRSQSAVSQQIQILEEMLNLRLLERRKGRIFLSQDGEKIYATAKSSFRSLDDEISALKGAKENVEGHIRLGELDDFGNLFQLGNYLAEFALAYPKISFCIQKGTSPSLEKDLIENKIDLGFLVYFSSPEMFRKIAVDKTNHSLYTSKAYFDQRGGIKTFRQIVDGHLVDLDKHFMCLGTFIKKNAPSLLARLKRRRPNIVVSNHLSARQLILSGFGAGILPDYFVDEELKSGQLIRLMKSAKSIHAGLDLAYRTNRSLNLCEKHFISYIRSKMS